MDRVSQVSTWDHDYNLAVLKEACDEEDIQEMEDMEESTLTHMNEHTPLPSPDPKKLKKREMKTRDREANFSNDNIYEANQTVLQRSDTLDTRLKSFKLRIEANTQAVKENKGEIEKMQKQIVSLKKENDTLKEMCKDNARYKMRWDLRLLGFPEERQQER